MQVFKKKKICVLEQNSSHVKLLIYIYIFKFYKKYVTEVVKVLFLTFCFYFIYSFINIDYMIMYFLITYYSDFLYALFRFLCIFRKLNILIYLVTFIVTKFIIFCKVMLSIVLFLNFKRTFLLQC